ARPTFNSNEGSFFALGDLDSPTWANFLERVTEVTDSFAGVQFRDMGDHVLVGTAAAQALMGEPDPKNLQQAFEEKGSQVRAKHERELPRASGVGGRVRPIAKAAVPLSFGRCGALEFLVLRAPALFRSRPANVVHFDGDPETTAKMEKLASGRRSMCLIGRGVKEFRLHPDLARKFPSIARPESGGSASWMTSRRGSWEIMTGRLRLHHVKPRRHLTNKEDLQNVPAPLDRLTGRRAACCKFQDASDHWVECYFEGDWKQGPEDVKTHAYWIGFSDFYLEK
ncbi:unnamed protein product, partial [Prorocentrum cordatum]